MGGVPSPHHLRSVPLQPNRSNGGSGLLSRSAKYDEMYWTPDVKTIRTVAHSSFIPMGKYRISKLRRLLYPMINYGTMVGLLLGISMGMLICSWSEVGFGPCNAGSVCCYGNRMPLQSIAQKTNSLLFGKRHNASRGATALTNEVRRRKTVLIGVMTAQKYLDNRALTVFKTWARTLPGDVLFFTREGAVVPEGLPAIALPGVDDSYPPQKKSFAMLRYMHQNFLDEYDWFLRADDDIHVDGEKLHQFLSSIDSNRLWLIGQEGQGMKSELGKLSLSADENFCMGGPGVILSRALLTRMGPHLGHCLSHMRTTHEDVEVGRCARDWAGVQCTWSFEMQQLFYHNYNYKDKTGFPYSLNGPETQNAITLHPIKDPQTQFKVYVNSLQNKVRKLSQEVHDMRTEINKISKAVIGPSSALNEVSLKPSLAARTDHVYWDTFSSTSTYSAKNLVPVKMLNQFWKTKLQEVVIRTLTEFNKRPPYRISYTFKGLLSGYKRVVRDNGLQVILDIMVMSYSKTKGTKPGTVRIALLYPFLQMQLTQVTPNSLYRDDQMIKPIRISADELPNNADSLYSSSKISWSPQTDKPDIYFVVPLHKRYNAAKRFFTNFMKLVKAGNTNLRLTVILYESVSSKRTLTLLNGLPSHIVTIVQLEGAFSRGKALHSGINAIKTLGSPHDILFIVDVDILVKQEALDNIRFNTKLHDQVYFPIIFSQYEPTMACMQEKELGNPCDLSIINERHGQFRNFGFGIMSMCKGDYDALGGYNLTIEGWGMEDVNFYSNAVNSALNVFRAPDPNLVHIYHPVVCDKNLSKAQYTMCVGSEASVYGSHRTLAHWLSKSQKMFSSKYGRV